MEWGVGVERAIGDPRRAISASQDDVENFRRFEMLFQGVAGLLLPATNHYKRRNAVGVTLN
jgi:hypothetical protein